MRGPDGDGSGEPRVLRRAPRGGATHSPKPKRSNPQAYVPWAPQSKPKRGLNIFQNVFEPCQSPRRLCKTTFKEKRGSGGPASCLLRSR